MTALDRWVDWVDEGTMPQGISRVFLTGVVVTALLFAVLGILAVVAALHTGVAVLVVAFAVLRWLRWTLS